MGDMSKEEADKLWTDLRTMMSRPGDGVTADDAERNLVAVAFSDTLREGIEAFDGLGEIERARVVEDVTDDFRNIFDDLLRKALELEIGSYDVVQLVQGVEHALDTYGREYNEAVERKYPGEN